MVNLASWEATQQVLGFVSNPKLDNNVDLGSSVGPLSLYRVNETVQTLERVH